MTQRIAFATPYLPGTLEEERQVMASISTGERAADHAASRRRAGITREIAWLQETPEGPISVTYLEADDLAVAMQTLATSEDSHDVWFRELLQRIHGIDISEPAPPPELLLDLSF